MFRIHGCLVILISCGSQTAGVWEVRDVCNHNATEQKEKISTVVVSCEFSDTTG